MGLFDRKKLEVPAYLEPQVIEDNIPVAQFDLSKRYDIHAYCGGMENRVYENMKIVGMRTFEKLTTFSMGTSGNYMEIEAPDGRRAFIPVFHISVLCEHGSSPLYKTVNESKPAGDEGK